MASFINTVLKEAKKTAQSYDEMLGQAVNPKTENSNSAMDVIRKEHLLGMGQTSYTSSAIIPSFDRNLTVLFDSDPEDHDAEMVCPAADLKKSIGIKIKHGGYEAFLDQINRKNN